MIDNDLKKMLAECDSLVTLGMKRQELDKSHKWYGAVTDSFGIHNVIDTSAFIRSFTCSFAMPESKFYKSEEFYQCVEIALKYLLQSQHSDGTIDLYATNFHSPPDTAFVTERLCSVYTVLKNLEDDKTTVVLEDLKTFILKASEALTYGGVHTPNHRWIVSNVLSRINHLFPNPNYVKRIDQWLAEEVDMDEDGQFSEKSTAIYSPMCDRCFITMARLLNRSKLYEYTRRNLNMAMYYIHPGGEAVTLTSKRQDKDQLFYLTAYYYSFRYMAIYDNNGQYAAMARKIMATSKENFDDAYTTYLIHSLEDPFVKQEMPESAPLPENYEKYFTHSNYARIRRENTSVTIASNSPGIMSMYKCKAIMQKLRLSYAFFGKAQFEGEKIEKIGNSYIITKKLDAGYYQALEEDCKKAPDRDWHDWYYEESRAVRDRTQNCELEVVVKITEKENAVFEVNITALGTDNVPVSVEFGFNKGGKLEGVEKIKDYDDAYLLKDGYGKYIFNDETIEFGPGYAEHAWIEIRGAQPKLNADSVYLTGYTPFDRTFKIW
jgi:hypothetical protein